MCLLACTCSRERATGKILGHPAVNSNACTHGTASVRVKRRTRSSGGAVPAGTPCIAKCLVHFWGKFAPHSAVSQSQPPAPQASKKRERKMHKLPRFVDSGLGALGCWGLDPVFGSGVHSFAPEQGNRIFAVAGARTDRRTSGQADRRTNGQNGRTVNEIVKFLNASVAQRLSLSFKMWTRSRGRMPHVRIPCPRYPQRPGDPGHA